MSVDEMGICYTSKVKKKGVKKIIAHKMLPVLKVE